MRTHKNKLIKVLLVFCCCLGARYTWAQPTRFSFETYKSNTGESLSYRMLYPDYDTLRKYPLVIFLHGSGERGIDNEAQLKWGVANFATDRAMSEYPCFVIAPQCPPNQGWSNFSQAGNNGTLILQPTPAKPMALLMELIRQFVTNYNVDTNRIYITGLSMGGYGTYDAIERYPDMFAAAVPVCGAGDLSKAASIANIPLWIFHGADDVAVSPAYSVDMLNALTKAGARPGFTQYPGVGHFSWLAAYNDPMMLQWLFRQHK